MSARLERPRLDSAGIRRFLRGPKVQAASLAEAVQVAARARTLAPRDTGALVESIEVRVVVDDDRARAYVVATAPHAAVVESRTHFLARALEG